LEPFVPLFRNPHLLTIAGNYWPRPADPLRFPITAKLYETEPGVQVLVHSQYQADRPYSGAVAHLVLVHGLEGSSDAGYARSLSHRALERGLAVHRFNMRSCGGTEHLSGKVLYHSGQTSDLLFFIRQIGGGAPVILTGFSLGGNVVLKLGGELGESARGWIAGIAAVSTPIDLAACARQLQRPSNALYSRRFLKRLEQRILSKERQYPGLFRLEDLARVRSIYDFDDLFTARSFGFGTADNYYATQSSNQFLERIRVPTLLVQAKDDPMIPFEVYQHPAFARNPNLRLIAVEHGGHLGFVARNKPRLWLDGALVEWIEGLSLKPESPRDPRNKLPEPSVL
jgi:uncharacterized protein